MGPCGQGNQGTLYSLRSGEKRRNIKPMITLEFADGIVYQVKGKANKAPAEDMYPYIDWFIENMGVEQIVEDGMHSSDDAGFAKMVEYLQRKHPDIKFEDSWISEATEVLEQFAVGMESDSQTSQEVSWPSPGDEEVDFLVLHQAFWPVKDIIVDEDTARLRFKVKEEAHFIAAEAFNPNPRIRSVDVFARGVQDSKAAMLRVELTWSESFRPYDANDEQDVAEEIGRLTNFLADMEEVSAYLVSSNAAPEEAEFDYNEFWEGIQEKLEEYGVYRDVAGEEDEQTKRDREEEEGQQRLPLQESKILESWAKIIK